MTMTAIPDYFNLAQEEILLKRKQIKVFITVPKLLGDFCEEIIRDYLKSHIPPQFKVTRGVIANPRQEVISRECDIIIYDSTTLYPLFKTETMAVIPSHCVRAIVEVKSDINNNAVDQALETFRSIHDIERSIPCFLLGFETGRTLEGIQEGLGKENLGFVLSKRNGNMIPDQFNLFMRHLERVLR